MSAADTAGDDDLSSLLTPDEIQALADHEQDLKAQATEKQDDDDDVTFVDLQAAPAPAPAPAAAAEAPAPAAAAPAQAATAPAPAPQEVESIDDIAIVPTFKAELPADFNDKVKSLTEREAQAEQRLDDGEIDRAEHRRLMREIADERKPLERQQLKVELAAEMHEQQLADATRLAANRVIALAKTQGLAYETDGAKWDDLRSFAAQLESRHPDKSPGWVLAEAHKRVLALHDIRPTASPAPEPAPSPAQRAAAPAADPKAAAMAARKPDLSAAPQTLAQVPGGDGPGDVQGEFADILALKGEDYEAAIGRLTAAQRERFEQVA